MYFRYFANPLLAALTVITVCTANPIHRPDRPFALSTDTTAVHHPATPSRSLPDSIRPRHALSKRAAPWTNLGNGWMATFVKFTPIATSVAARIALMKLYQGIGNHCMVGMLQGPTTPNNAVSFPIGDLEFTAESTSVMEWDTIFQFAMKMKEMIGHGPESMYTAFFAHDAGQAMMFSIRVAGMDGEPIP